MESSSKKRIQIILHLDNNIKKVLTVYLTDKLKCLESINSEIDFYFHGDKLKLDKTFE